MLQARESIQGCLVRIQRRPEVREVRKTLHEECGESLRSGEDCEACDAGEVGCRKTIAQCYFVWVVHGDFSDPARWDRANAVV